MHNGLKSILEVSTRRPGQVGIFFLGLLLVHAAIGRAQIPSLEEIQPQSEKKPVFKTKMVSYTGTNPHWQADGCSYCHQMNEQEVLTIPPERIDEICLGCHDGRQAPKEAHPIGRKPTFQKTAGLDQELTPEVISLPENWPLLEGKLSCLTCHDVKQACDSSKRRPLRNSTFLRGTTNLNRQKFCKNCHQSQFYQRHSPHVMIQNSKKVIQLAKSNKVIEGSCLFCHEQEPDRTSLVRYREAKLRTDQKTLCMICHPTHIDYYRPGHLGDEIPSDMQAYMYAREMIGPIARVDPKLLARLKQEGVHPTMFVPDENGKMTCSTCHNPHQEGVFLPESILNKNAMWLIGPGRLKSPTTNRQICVYCHQM